LHAALVPFSAVTFIAVAIRLQRFSQSLQFETSVKYAHAPKITRVAVFEYSGYVLCARAVVGPSTLRLQGL